DRPNVFIAETADALGPTILRAAAQAMRPANEPVGELGLSGNVQADLLRDVQSFLARAGRRPSLRPWKRLRDRQTASNMQVDNAGLADVPLVRHHGGS
ncbi:MAG: hypothetical protein AAGK78_07020, partial [Planctomycetota bacterium]